MTLMETDRHSAPDPVMLWGWLVLLLLAGMGAGFLGYGTLSTVFVFAVAVLKAALVAAYYMHLKFEPWIVKAVAIFALGVLFVLWLGLLPDVGRVSIP